MCGVCAWGSTGEREWHAWMARAARCDAGEVRDLSGASLARRGEEARRARLCTERSASLSSEKRNCALASATEPKRRSCEWRSPRAAYSRSRCTSSRHLLRVRVRVRVRVRARVRVRVRVDPNPNPNPA